MDRKIMAALVAISLLVLLPLSTASNYVIPYIKIENPVDGQTISGLTTVKISAAGYDLKNPVLSVSGEHAGFAIKLTNCVYSIPEARIAEDGSTDSGEIPEQGYPMRMYCTHDWNPAGFEGEKVTLTASVQEQGQNIDDTIRVYVSGICA